jgi:uncharacterized protein (TIGR00251 family)
MRACWLTPEGYILLTVVPGASKNQLVGFHNGRLKLKVMAPPEDGAANSAVIQLLSMLCQLRKSAFKIVAGAHSREKTVSVSGSLEKLLAIVSQFPE